MGGERFESSNGCIVGYTINNFADQSEKYIQIKLECGHDLHYHESVFMSEQIKEFMQLL